MVLPIILLFIQLVKSTTTIPYDGIIRHSANGSSYAFLSPPRTGNHASFIEQMTPSGTLAIAWFTGGEGQANTSISVSLLQLGSLQFTPGVIVSERINHSNQNPVLLWDNETQILHLYHTSQLPYSVGGFTEIWHVQSKDQGVTWSIPEPFYVVPGAYDRGRIIPTFNKNGLIFPCYNASPNIDPSFVLRSLTSISEWTQIVIKQSNQLIQPTIIRLNNSLQLRAFFRDSRAIWIYYADSNDDGLTWTIPKPTTLPNNAAGIDAYILKSGAVIMTYNNHNGTHQPRTPLTVALSYDNGITWPYQRNVQIHNDDSSSIGEYSYPSLIQSFWSDSNDNDIHLVYTYNRETIKYVRFNESWIKQGQEILNYSYLSIDEN